ncbi:hypothetical protein FKM82_031163 [Ascaphus truei]
MRLAGSGVVLEPSCAPVFAVDYGASHLFLDCLGAAVLLVGRVLRGSASSRCGGSCSCSVVQESGGGRPRAFPNGAMSSGWRMVRNLPS